MRSWWECMQPAVAGAITFSEALLNTIAHYFFAKYWDRLYKARQMKAGTDFRPVA